MKAAVDYGKIYECLEQRKGKVITASQIAFSIGVEKVYGGTMAKLVRDGRIEHMPLKGYYRVK